MAGGLTYGSMKTLLAEAAGNGVDPSSAFVLKATNSAIEELLHQEIIPVNAMATYDVVASGTTLLLPKELENAIEVEVQGAAEVNSQTDITQGFYTLVNNFTYVDPTMQHDNPLVDEFLQPDPGDATILRRQYDYPGLTANATVRVTGKKRYIPITVDGDYPIIQNIAALKSMMISQERKYRANDPDGAQKYKADAIQILQAEVKQHLLDPNNSMKRKAAYEADLVNYPQDTFGWTRARMAFELPNGLQMGKSEIGRLLDMAEMRLISRGQWVGTLQEFTADVTGGHLLMPKNVQAVVAIDLCGYPIDIKNVFLEYIRGGPGKLCNCSQYLIDEGETIYPNGDRRRQYRLRSSTDVTSEISFIGKLRWIKKFPTDFMTIKNFEALRYMVLAVMGDEQKEMQALNEVNRELTEYLSGQMQVVPVQLEDFSMCGGVH